MRSVRPSLLPVLTALVYACAPAEPMDHPFQPVPVKSTQSPPTDGLGDTPGPRAPDPRFAEFDQTFTISSEELSGGATGDATPAPAEPETAQTTDGDATKAGTEAESAPATAGAAPGTAGPPPASLPTLSMAASTPMVAQVPAAPLGWAIRLVSTIPEAQPPRAIVGLPDGREIVVTPGSMVPDAGLVVLSIGTQGVQLAHVQAMGDHATVAPITLQPQY